MSLGWHSDYNVPSHGWVCGYCGSEVGGDRGFHSDDKFPYGNANITFIR